MYLTIKLDPAGSWRVILMMCLTNKVYHRRALSYWFHIICNSLYLLSRPFSSPLCFMWLCPFLIIVTDRRSAEKDGENESESRDFVTAVFVCVNARSWVGVGVDIFPIGRDLYPPPHPFYSLSYVKRCIIQSKNGRHDWDRVQTITTDIEVSVQDGKNKQKTCRLFFNGCQWCNLS